MAESRLYNRPVYYPQGPNLLYPVASLWLIVAFSILVYLWFEGGPNDSRSNYYLLPWCFGTAAVIAAPSLYLLYKGKFSPFHPLVFPAWSYFLPGFCLGGLALAFRLSQPYYLTFVQDERYNLPLTFVYVMLGYTGLWVGFLLPFGRKIGETISGWLPVWNWSDDRVLGPGMILLALGFANTVLALIYGILGFQKVTEIGAYDGLIYLFSLFWLEATFLLWLYVFRTQESGIKQYLIIAFLLIASLTKSVVQGNRASLIIFFVLIAFAFVTSGRKIKLKHNVIGAALVILAIFGGMIYGTAFRGVKQNQDAIAMDQYAGIIIETFYKLSEQDISVSLENGFSSLAERIDAVTPLAVVVANYEKLASYEESYGLGNNIWKDSLVFFIPRIIWPEKPVSIDAANYADLYFDYAENSFTLTPMGDLLRNFGPYGVPLGMIFLGLVIRIIYASLMENQEFSYWRVTMFYMLLTSISYEGTFSLIIPFLFKVGFISIVGILIVRFFAGRGRAAI